MRTLEAISVGRAQVDPVSSMLAAALSRLLVIASTVPSSGSCHVFIPLHVLISSSVCIADWNHDDAMFEELRALLVSAKQAAQASQPGSVSPVVVDGCSYVLSEFFHLSL